MLRVILTNNWQFYWGRQPLPEGAEALGLINRDNRPTGVLLRLADGKYAQGNAGEVLSLPQRAVEKGLAAAEGAATIAAIYAKRKPKRGAGS
jgi:hypothetical protein